MRFYEYEARKIVELAGIPVTKYGFCTSAEQARKVAEEIGGPVVIKSQVLSGGRMKAGGVKFADTPDEAAEHAEAILKLEIGGHMPRGVLVDPKAEVAQEYYAGVVWDGLRKRPVMIFSPVGGRALTRITPILTRLARLFVEYDMTLAEINPLGELADGSFVALDAHMDMENEARPRQQALLGDLGVGEEETRQAREPTEFEL